MSLFAALNTARTGLFAQQAGLANVGNNIANANTEGFTRQTTVLAELNTGGVQLLGSQRMRDQFVTARLYNANADLSANTTLAANLGQIESALGASGDTSIGSMLQQFFSAFQSLTQKPGGSAERQAVLSDTGQLTAAFQSVSSQLGQIRDQLDKQVQDDVAQVNDLTAQIAKINSQLGTTPTTSSGVADSGTNSLLDERDRLINQLSKIVPVRTLDDGKNGLTVFMAGQPLVEGKVAHTLATRVNASNGGTHDVVLQGLGKGLDMTDKLQTGELAGLLKARDEGAGATLDDLDRLAAKLARDVNVQHRAGTGLDGVSGRNFFGTSTASATADAGNTGQAGVSATSIVDDTALTFDDYEIRFTTAGQYDVYNKTTGTALSTGNAYTSGSAITFDGMSVTIANGAGTPAAGDVFRVNSYSGGAAAIDLSAGVAGNGDAIAAGATSAPGDNTNALALAALQTKPAMGDPPSLTFESYWNNLAVRQGTATSGAQDAEASAQVTSSQLQALADSKSGVSLDEEAVNLIQYQRAFQASSRVISTADELMQSLIQMI